MNISYKWLQSYFEEPLPKVETLKDILTLHAFEIEGVEQRGDDFLIDVDVLPNRAHDCLGHSGIAKELGVLLGHQVVDNKKEENFKLQTSNLKSTLDVEIQSPDLCRRYVGRKINNIKIGSSPDWLVRRLETIGQKSINNIVDATNYVMFDLGQPMHAFDADKIDGGIAVRLATDGESLVTLDGRDVSLKSDILLIADDTEPLVIAGIKGGNKAEVNEDTTNIVLEAANFEPSNIRKTTRVVGIQTDSSKRFENEITPELCSVAMQEATRLILEIAGTEKTEVEDIVDVYPERAVQNKISISCSEVKNILGVDIDRREIEEIFLRLGFSFENNDGDFVVTVPFERLDLNIKEDLVEEIGRIYGYENIKPVPLSIDCTRKTNKRLYYMNKIREILRNNGYSENYGYTFRAKGEIEMAKALSVGKDFLRTNLTDGIKEIIEFNDRNKDLLAIDRVRVFELGAVFKKNKEWVNFAIGLGMGKKKGETDICEVLNGSLGLKLECGIFGKQGGVFEVNFDELLNSLPEVKDKTEALKQTAIHIEYKKISPFPFMLRDIAVWVQEGIQPEEVFTIIEKCAGELLVQSKLFDIYEKDGRVSYAFGLVFQSQNRTLTDTEVNTVMDKITVKISENNWEVR